MKNGFLKTITLIFVGLLFLLAGCTDHKTPEKGYITEEELLSIVKNFASTTTVSSYSYSGNLNYFNYDENLVPQTISKKNVEFVDSLNYYSTDSSSYYLRLPLHLTLSNWTSEEKNNSGLSLSTKYQLESKIYRPAGLDRIYYYKRAEGGFILKAFGVNKALIIKRPSDITCHAKWNITVEYNEDGYLVKEAFATVNTAENNKDECCYGEATYKYS